MDRLVLPAMTDRLVHVAVVEGDAVQPRRLEAAARRAEDVCASALAALLDGLQPKMVCAWACRSDNTIAVGDGPLAGEGIGLRATDTDMAAAARNVLAMTDESPVWLCFHV